MSKLIFLLFFILICEISAINIKDINTPKMPFFEVILDRIENVLESEELFQWHLKIKKVSKTRALVGYVENRVSFGNDFNLGFKLLKKQGGEYRYLPYNVPPSPFCESLAKDVLFYPDLAKNSDYPEDIKNNCPLLPGNISVNGYTVNLDNIPTTAIQSGEYAVEFLFDKNDKHVAIYRGYAYVNNV